MLSKLILHSPIPFNYSRFLNFHMNGEKYFKHHNNYLIPFRCKDINYAGQLIIGNFVYPVSNTLQKLILYKGAHFTYTYMLGDKFTLENRPASLKCYNIFHENMNTDDNIINTTVGHTHMIRQYNTLVNEFLAKNNIFSIKCAFYQNIRKIFPSM